MPKMLQAIGLMSGTSMDGVDAALVCTDGEKITDTGHFFSISYDPELRARLRGIMLKTNISKIELLRVEKEITIVHAEAVNRLLKKSGVKKSEIDLIGFHGQTIAHFPNEGITWQIGNGALLAELTGINVIDDFRRHDMAAGGQGAPLVPFFHAAIASEITEPIAMLNIGGVANVTYIEKIRKKGKAGKGEGGIRVMAFDTGPGGALLDDWIYQHTGKYFDEDGKIAGQGKVDEKILSTLLDYGYFKRKPPKALDRDHFARAVSLMFGMKRPLRRRATDPVIVAAPEPVLSLEDGAATLAAFTAMSIAKACDFFPAVPARWLVCGGGRKNDAIMSSLQKNLKGKVEKIEALGFNGDTLEAQAFGFLGVRSYFGMPLSLPETTGVKRLVTGGAFYRA